MVCRRTGCYFQPNICSSRIFWSLQLQHHETIHETATYGSVRPYRESPLLARARRTESFHSYRDFQAFNLSSKSPTDKAAAANGNSSQTEARKATAEGSAAERKAVQSTALEVRGTGVTDAGGCCSTEVHRLPDNSLDLKRRGPEEENETKAESKKKMGFEGAGFLGRKKVPLLASAPVLAEGGPELPGAASPSPTKTAASPRHRKNDSSCQDYGLWKWVWWQKQGASALWLVAGMMLHVGCFLSGIWLWYENKTCKVMRKSLAAAKALKGCPHQCVALCNAPKCSTVLGPKYCCAFLRKCGQACDMLWLFLFWGKENLVAEQRMPSRCSCMLLYSASAVLGGFCLIHRAASVVLFYEWDPWSICCCLISEMFCAG